MPVLNPAFPHANTCHSVGRSGIVYFYEELSRMHLHLQSPVASSLQMPWVSCFAEYRIGDHFSQFLIVEVQSSHLETAESDRAGGEGNSKSACGENSIRDFYVWSGLVESRMRLLLYAVEELCIARAHPEQLQNPSSSSPCHWFAIGVKASSSDQQSASSSSSSSLTVAYFAKAIALFRFCLLQGQQQANGASPFVRRPSTMLEPRIFLASQASALTLPEQLMPSTTDLKAGNRKRSRAMHDHDAIEDDGVCMT